MSHSAAICRTRETGQRGVADLRSPAHRVPQHRVFVVDDEHVIASTLATILRFEGFDSAGFTVPHEALEAARKEAPDLLISDVVMGQVSGIEVAIQFRQRWPECKILLFSGQSTVYGLLEDANRRGYQFELLQKPMHPVDLVRKVRSVLEGVPSRDTRYRHRSVA